MKKRTNTERSEVRKTKIAQSRIEADSAKFPAHMQKKVDANPHLKDSRRLPKDIEERLKIQKKQDRPRPTSTQELSEYEKWLKSFAKYRYAIEKIVETPEFEDYCNKCIAEDSHHALLKLFHVVSRRYGIGTVQLDLFVLAVTLEHHETDENHHFFERIVKIVDGEEVV
jgi:hypothetical protein